MVNNDDSAARHRRDARRYGQVATILACTAIVFSVVSIVLALISMLWS